MRMSVSGKREIFLETIDMLEEVVTFKKTYYPCAWASYDSAKPGALKLVPAPERTKELEADYQQMKVMIFGEAPEFHNIISALQDLEDNINNPAQGRNE